MFAVSSDVATSVTLCLFDDAGREERLPIPGYDAGVWRGFVAGIGPGQRYGYRVDGPYDPRAGHRRNPATVLLDPYAQAIDGDVLDTYGSAPVGTTVAGETFALRLRSVVVLRAPR